MKIGIDLDDTISKTAEVLQGLAEKFNKEKQIKHIIDQSKWNFYEAFGWDDKNTHEFYNRYIKDFYTKPEPIKNAREIISQLRKEKNEIIIVTARNNQYLDNIYEICENWLKNNGFEFDKLIVNAEIKSIECETEKIDVFIDDSIDNCEDVYNNLKIPVLLMNSQYNQCYENTNIKRVYNWDEIYTEINKIKSVE